MKRMSASLLFTAVTLTLGHVHAQSVSPESLQVPKAAKFDTRYNSTDPKIVVFDDGQKTYVALPREMPNPIVMSTVPSGEMLLQPTQMSPYLLLPGIHKKLKFLWGNTRDVFVVHTGSSGVERNGVAAAFGAVAPVALHGAVAKPTLTEVKNQVVKDAEALKSQSPIAGKVIVATAVRSDKEDARSTVASVVVETEKGSSAVDPAYAPTPKAIQYVLNPPETVRSALERWAAQADWIFGSQHYAVTVDFPVVASTEIPVDFKAAVRTLLDSTALTDTPVQPCFYSNRVLRVVPRHELCARP